MEAGLDSRETVQAALFSSGFCRRGASEETVAENGSLTDADD